MLLMAVLGLAVSGKGWACFVLPDDSPLSAYPLIARGGLPTRSSSLLRLSESPTTNPHLTRYRRARLSPLAIEAGMGPSYYVGDITGVFNIGAQGYLTRLHAAFAATYRWTEHLSTRGSFTMYRHRVRATREVWERFGFESDNGQLAVSAFLISSPSISSRRGPSPYRAMGCWGWG